MEEKIIALRERGPRLGRSFVGVLALGQVQEDGCTRLSSSPGRLVLGWGRHRGT